MSITAIPQNEVCYRTRNKEKPADLETYIKLGGYQSLTRLLQGKITPAQVIAELKISDIRGRGGAAFPTGLKWHFLSRDLPGEKYIVCNSDEGEPGTFKDREIHLCNPHQLIEGIVIAAYVIGANKGFNYVRGEFVEPINIFNKALIEANKAGYLGKSILKSGFDFDLYFQPGAGAYICGEETALIESLEGKKGLPRFKPPYLSSYGLYGKPTIVNNTETLASIPVILEKGGAWFRDIGIPNSAGTKIFSVSGHVNKPGNFEIRMGTSFKDLLELAGGMKGGNLKAVIPGGPSTSVIPAEQAMSMTMDFDSIDECDSSLGAGSVIIMNEHTDMVKVLKNISHFYYDESCGQCTPCREGTGWMYRVVSRIQQGKGNQQDLDNLKYISARIDGNVICGLGDAAAVPIQSFIKHFRQEFENYIKPSS